MTTGAGARPGPFDVLVLGSGVAGLSAAVRLAGPGSRPSDSRIPAIAKFASIAVRP